MGFYNQGFGLDLHAKKKHTHSLGGKVTQLLSS